MKLSFLVRKSDGLMAILQHLFRERLMKKAVYMRLGLTDIQLFIALW